MVRKNNNQNVSITGSALEAKRFRPVDFLLSLAGRPPALGKFGRDCIWNFASLAVLAVSGIFLNILIARFYGAGILGVFNQVFALYIILSQFAAGGFYFSTLKFVSEHGENRKECGRIVTTGSILTACVSSLVCGAALGLSGRLGHLLESPGVTVGVQFVAPGLVFFALNKVLLASVNGLRHMKTFAACQAMRFLLLLAALILVWRLELGGYLLPVIFTAAEIVLFLFLAAYFIWLLRLDLFRVSLLWARRHLEFAWKALPSGVLMDTNTRVDVLVLAYFCSDRTVGIYSLAAFFAEGLYQISIVVQNNMNPILTQVTLGRRHAELKSLVAKSHKYFLPIMVITGLAACLVYPVLVKLLTGGGDFMESWPLFTILVSGVVISSGYTPFAVIFSQAGHPGWFSLFLASIVATNLALNVMLIPLIGATGAAAATAAALVMSIVYLKALSGKVLGVRI